MITKNGKKPNGKPAAGKKPTAGKKPAAKPAGKKPAGKKARSFEQIQKDCNKATKAELISAVTGKIASEMNKRSKAEICHFIDQMTDGSSSSPPPRKISQKRIDKYLEKWNANRHSNPEACDNNEFVPKCYGRYCAKNGDWACPDADFDVIAAGEMYKRDYELP